ncbi:MAG: undecaprenyl-diphosphate phosphatase, partial [Sphaerospermopsis sp. SIO1G2]|nr:undecaprenyl-diphosphate phosphatase [Sphaerospermopsis sp. SIO1G2]
VALLGIVEGITEFLPVSSTGHLILLIDLLGFNAPEGKVFEVVVQLGAILAICIVFRERVTDVVCHLHHKKSTQKFVGLVILAFLPAAVIGAFGHHFIKEVLFSPIVVSVMLVIGGVMILIIERCKPPATIHHVDAMGAKQAIIIGFCQALAMIPGTSRSGATMMGGLLMGIDRKTAAEFSFLLAIPTMAAATAYDLYKNFHHLSLDDGLMIGVGFMTAFLSALVTVRFLLGFLAHHGFGVFAWYRIALGCVMLLLLH